MNFLIKYVIIFVSKQEDKYIYLYMLSVYMLSEKGLHEKFSLNLFKKGNLANYLNTKYASSLVELTRVNSARNEK